MEKNQKKSINRGLPTWLSGKEFTYSAGDSGDMGSIPGQEDPLGKEMATNSSIPAWRVSWTEEPGRLHGVTRVGYD